MRYHGMKRAAALALALGLLLAACGPSVTPAATSVGGADARLQVVATTTLVGDVARHVGGEQIVLTVLLPPGADPHSFEPTPRDMAAVADADLVLVNGLGLEAFLEPMLERVGGAERIVAVSEGVETRQLVDGSPREAREADEKGAEETGAHADDRHHQDGVDPHVWFDPNRIRIWVRNIERALAARDPDNRGRYARSAERYHEMLDDLDRWIRAEVERVPSERRMLVTDHRVLGYFAAAYGFEQIGAVVPGLSTMAAPSARELAALEDAIAAREVPAVFVGTTVDTDVAERVAEDTGVLIVRLYTGSLSPPDGPAASYDAFMRYNVSAIVDALAR